MSEIPSKAPLLASPLFPPLAHHDVDFDVDDVDDFDDVDVDFVDDVDDVDDEEYVANREILDKFVQ